MGMKLFNNDEDHQNEDISKIEINKEYARRFEHNKKREDLQRYEELKKRGHVEESDEESSDDEEDDDYENFSDQITVRKKDEDFFKALIRVRSRDPILKEKDVELFESDDDESSKQEEESEKKDKKAMYLKDVVAKHLIEEGPDFLEQDAAVEQKKKVTTYDEEQEEIKKALLDATEEVDNEDDGDFLRLKEKKGRDDEEKEDFGDGEFSKKLEEYFGEDAKMDENTKFLKEFFKNKMWIDKERKGDLMIDNEVVDEVLRDEEEIERQEGYELGYNFRHEENAEDRVLGYSRKIEGSVRKKESKRKAQRERKEERMTAAEMERKEELKHLKNLKKEEIKERMKKVMEIAGIKKDEECPFSAKDLEEEFDPEEYDKMMKAVFDENYYGDEDMEFNSDSDGIEKPDFDKEDELLGLPKGWDVLESHDGFLAARERNKHKLQSEEDKGEEVEGEHKNKEDDGDGDGDDVDDEAEEHKNEDEEDEDDKERKEEETEEGKRKRKRKMSVVQKALQEMWEEFYNLDYEGTIGDLKTRFKYVKIKPNRYGLKPKEILALDEKELNQYVSLKKLAPYTDKEWKVPDSKRYQQKLRIKELLKEKRNGKKAGKKRSRDAAEQSTSRLGGGKEDKKAKLEDSDGDMMNLSKQGKKKRSQTSNISESRRKAYGMISSKPKKNKHKH